jgi:hypothetical protein
MNTPEGKSVTFTFMSQPTSDPKGCWVARLTFPGGSNERSVLPIEIVQGDGSPVMEAVFEFAGQRLAVRNGKARLSFVEFVRGKHESALWLHRKDVEAPIPGGLTFA